MLFAQGERLGARCFRNLAALQKKSNLWSPPTSRAGWAKRLHCKKSKHKLTNVSTGHSEQPLHTWGIWQEKPAGVCAGWAGTAWQCGSLAAQERIWCGRWGIAGRFSTATLLQTCCMNSGSSFNIVMMQLVLCNVYICYLV